MPKKDDTATLQNSDGGVDALLDDDPANVTGPNDPDDVDGPTYEELQKQLAAKDKLYAESSKEGKRLNTLTKEQEARIKKLEEATEGYEEWKPIIDLAHKEEGFAKHILSYLSNAQGTQTQTDGTTAFSDFDVTELGDKNSDSYKNMSKMIGEIVGQQLGAFAEQRDKMTSDKERRTSFFAEHKDVKPEQLDEAVEWAKGRSKGKLYEDLWTIYQNANKNTSATNTNQQNTDTAITPMDSTLGKLPPSLAADGTVNTKKSPADDMYTTLAGILNQKDLGSELSRQL